MDWNNQYCKNDYRIHKNIQIQYIPFQIIKDIFHRIGIKNFTICMETQKPLNTQRNFEGKKKM